MQCIAQPTNQQHGWIRSDIVGIHDIYPQVYTQLKSEKHAKMKKSHLVSALLTHSLSALSSLPHSRRIARPSLTHSLTAAVAVVVAVADSLSLPLTPALWCSFVRSFVRSFVHPQPSLTQLTHYHTLCHSLSVLDHSLTHSVPPLFTHLHSQPLTAASHSLTHSPTHSLTPPFSHSPPPPHHRAPIGCLLDRLIN